MTIDTGRPAPAAPAASSYDPPARHTMQQSNSRLRLQTLVRLRWIGLAGQLLTVLFVYRYLKFPLPFEACLIIIGISAALNLFLRVRFAARHRLAPIMATALLAYDLLQLSALLYLTGGLENPFSFLVTAPVMVSAATLPSVSTIILSFVAMSIAALLGVFHLPLPWPGPDPFKVEGLYLVGVWTSIVCGLMFMGLYARRLAREARLMSDALAATELVLAREQKLHALDGLAAAAAHELGTPLSTITVVVKEMLHSTPKDSPIADDLELLRTQSQRCREILGRLAHSANAPDPLLNFLPISHLIEETIEPYRVFEMKFNVDAAAASGVTGKAEEEPVTTRRPGVLHALSNIVENAQDFARAEVNITARWTEKTVTLEIADDGRGFHPQVIGSLGEPYVTTRPQAERERKDQDAPGGLGLGFFIAKTLLERSGAEIVLTNRKPPATGAVVEISWPRAVFEANDTEGL